VGITAVGSAFVDNVVFVAAFVPIIKSLAASGLHAMPLWWALLFGACYGGNITMIGSTANIVALGMLEKSYHGHIRFLDWLKVGLLVGVITCAVSAGCLMLLSRWMPRTSVEHTAHVPSFQEPKFTLPLLIENSTLVVNIRHPVLLYDIDEPIIANVTPDMALSDVFE
jgi:hypothetical protein